MQGAFVVAISAVLLTVGCDRSAPSGDASGPAEPSSATSSSATAASDDAACTTVDAPLVAIPSEAGQPALSIPQPPGWEPASEATSELIPYAMVNRDLARDGFAPTAVVTRESVEGTVPSDAVFESNRNTLTSAGVTDLTVTPGKLCGQPAERVEYTCLPAGQVGPRPCRLLNVVTSGDDRTYLITVTVQTTDPTNPAYQQDSDTILDGFEVIAP